MGGARRRRRRRGRWSSPPRPVLSTPAPSRQGEAVAFLVGAAASTSVPTPAARPAAGECSPKRRPEEVTWGAAEFVAAEEMGRSAGSGGRPMEARFWRLAWTTAPSRSCGRRTRRRRGRKPQRPLLPPRRYRRRRRQPLAPAGVPAGASRTQVMWEAERYPYLVDVHWSRRAAAAPGGAEGPQGLCRADRRLGRGDDVTARRGERRRLGGFTRRGAGMAGGRSAAVGGGGRPARGGSRWVTNWLPRPACRYGRDPARVARSSSPRPTIPRSSKLELVQEGRASAS